MKLQNPDLELVWQSQNAPWLASLLNLCAKCFEITFQLKTALLRFHDGPPVKAPP
jgi:hypothetical protein